MSNDCSLDTSKQSTPKEVTDETDDDHSVKLRLFKQKRASTQALIEHLDRVNIACRLRLVEQPYLHPYDHLPPWLVGLLELGLSIPLVPAFPTSKQAFAELVSELDLNHPDDVLLEDYERASSYARRVRLGVVGKSQSRRTSFCSWYPRCFVREEISDGSARAGTDPENEQFFKQFFSQKLAGNGTNLRNIRPRGTRLAHANNEIVTCCNDRTPVCASSNRIHYKRQEGGMGVLFLEDDLQQLENSLVWVPHFISTKAVIEECNSERILITGKFPADTFGSLQFKLMLFPGERTGAKYMRVTGTFLRSAERSNYNLKWKYDIHIPASFVPNQFDYAYPRL